MFYFTLIIGLVSAFIVKDLIKSAKIYTIFLAILAAFRYGIGADYFSYMFLYRELRINIIPEIRYGVEKQEAGFRALGSFLKTLGFSYQMYLTLFAIITLFFICKISVEYSKNPMLSMVVYYSFYYFVWTYSGLRQGLAMTVGMYFMLNAIHKNEKIRFYIVSLLLFTIHSSSLILLIMYVMVVYFPWNRKWIIVTIVLSIAFAFIPFGSIIVFLREDITILQRFPYFLEDPYTLKDLFSFQVIPRLILISIVLFYYNDLAEISPTMKKIVHIYLLSFVFYFVFQFSELAAARISIYGRILDLIILPNLLYLKVGKKERKIIFIGLLILISLYFLKELNTMKEQSGLVLKEQYLVPYSSIFDKNGRYYNTLYYYVLYYGANKSTPMNFHMIQ